MFNKLTSQETSFPNIIIVVNMGQQHAAVSIVT